MCLLFEKQMRLVRSRLSGSAVLSSVTAISWRWSGIICAAAQALVFLFDRATREAPVEHLYYIPLLFAALRFGRIGGAITPWQQWELTIWRCPLPCIGIRSS